MNQRASKDPEGACRESPRGPVFFFAFGDTNWWTRPTWVEAGPAGPQIVRDLWRKKTVGTYTGKVSALVSAHDCAVLRMK